MMTVCEKRPPEGRRLLVEPLGSQPRQCFHRPLASNDCQPPRFLHLPQSTPSNVATSDRRLAVQRSARRSVLIGRVAFMAVFVFEFADPNVKNP